MKYITDTKAFKAACDSITKRGAKLDADIQVAAMSAAYAMQQNNNPMYANMLYLALQKGARKAAMTEWFIKYAGLMANDGKNKAEMPFKYDSNRVVDLVGGAAEPWYDCKPDAEPDMVFDVVAAVQALIKKAKGNKGGVDQVALLKLENFASSLTNQADDVLEVKL